jgi:hypothetical protein
VRYLLERLYRRWMKKLLSKDKKDKKDKIKKLGVEIMIKK